MQFYNEKKKQQFFISRYIPGMVGHAQFKKYNPGTFFCTYVVDNPQLQFDEYHSQIEKKNPAHGAYGDETAC